MGRRKQTAAPPEPEDESQEPPEDEDGGDQVESEESNAQPSGRPGGKVKKADAVRAALAEGIDGPEEGVAFILDRFGIEMKRTHFSAVKSQLKKREAEGGEAPAPKAPRAKHAEPAEGYLAPPPQQTSGQPDLLAAMEAMKPLVASLGKDQVKRIVELLG